MDQRFTVFVLEKYRLKLKQGARSFYEDEIENEKARRPNKLGSLMRHMVTWIIASSKAPKKTEGVLMNAKRTTNQSYTD
jgi:hypothetical protein